MTVQLEFVAHACFRLWEDGRPTIVMDPLTFSELKLPAPEKQLEADTIIASSLTDPAHSNLGAGQRIAAHHQRAGRSDGQARN